MVTLVLLPSVFVMVIVFTLPPLVLVVLVSLMLLLIVAGVVGDLGVGVVVANGGVWCGWCCWLW